MIFANSGRNEFERFFVGDGKFGGCGDEGGGRAEA
jgi:hypothetical protein